MPQDIGAGRGKYYAVNFPLRDGIDDEVYEQIFVPIMSKVMETYQPSAIVLQCGADSLSGDRLGCFNLTLNGRSTDAAARICPHILYRYRVNVQSCANFACLGFLPCSISCKPQRY